MIEMHASLQLCHAKLMVIYPVSFVKDNTVLKSTCFLFGVMCFHLKVPLNSS